MIDTWLEHRDHGTYPEPGGYNDQDAQLMLDWRVMNARFNRQMRIVSDSLSNTVSLPTSNNAQDWTDFD